MVGVAVAFAVSAVAGLAAWRLGPTLGYVDVPDDPGLKVHTRPAVPLGGLAVFAGTHLGLAAAGRFDVVVFAATTLLMVLGLVDDRMGLPPRVRLGVEVVAGGLLAMAFPGRGLAFGLLVAGTVVVVVNAVNLFDGLDGLAGSVSLLSSLALAVFAAHRGGAAVAALVVAGALVGFLIHNWHPARLFFGDNGAYFVAGMLVALIAEPAGSVSELVVGLGLLGLLLVDLVSTVLRRRIAGKPMFLGDRSHIYDRIHATGRSVPQVVAMVALLHVLVVGVVVAADLLLAPVPAASATVVAGIVAIAVAVRGAGAATAADGAAAG